MQIIGFEAGHYGTQKACCVCTCHWRCRGTRDHCRNKGPFAKWGLWHALEVIQGKLQSFHLICHFHSPIMYPHHCIMCLTQSDWVCADVSRHKGLVGLMIEQEHLGNHLLVSCGENNMNAKVT